MNYIMISNTLISLALLLATPAMVGCGRAQNSVIKKSSTTDKTQYSGWDSGLTPSTKWTATSPAPLVLPKGDAGMGAYASPPSSFSPVTLTPPTPIRTEEIRKASFVQPFNYMAAGPGGMGAYVGISNVSDTRQTVTIYLAMRYMTGPASTDVTETTQVKTLEPGASAMVAVNNTQASSGSHGSGTVQGWVKVTENLGGIVAGGAVLRPLGTASGSYSMDEESFEIFGGQVF